MLEKWRRHEDLSYGELRVQSPNQISAGSTRISNRTYRPNYGLDNQLMVMVVEAAKMGVGLPNKEMTRIKDKRSVGMHPVHVALEESTSIVMVLRPRGKLKRTFGK